jgi:hypothetical protein
LSDFSLSLSHFTAQPGNFRGARAPAIGARQSIPITIIFVDVAPELGPVVLNFAPVLVDFSARRLIPRTAIMICLGWERASKRKQSTKPDSQQSD